MIDATRGLVLEHKVHFDITKPVVIKAGKKDPILNISRVAEVKIDMERKLEKLEKE